ncbi:TOBE domain-containing protein, partial [Roseicyclus sp.]|uniref:TOBE domain-containing protein n=1 Tax=Roseicyclus sp. TaxID=1914329 RepID=UPI003F6BB74C
LDANGIALFLPQLAQSPGTPLRVRIAAHDVLLSRGRPEGLSALNILPGLVQEIRAGEGPGAIVAIDTAAGRVLARVTRRSATALALAPGVSVHAIVKSVSVAPGDVGGAAGSEAAR